jgi:hypothetical protein
LTIEHDDSSDSVVPAGVPSAKVAYISVFIQANTLPVILRPASTSPQVCALVMSWRRTCCSSRPRPDIRYISIAILAPGGCSFRDYRSARGTRTVHSARQGFEAGPSVSRILVPVAMINSESRATPLGT